MRIENSNILMHSSRSYMERHEKKDSLRIWTGDKRPDFEGLNSPSAPPSSSKGDILIISEKAKTHLPSNEEGQDIIEPGIADKLKALIIEKLIESLTGKKLEIITVRIKSQDAGPENINKPATDQTPVPLLQGWGIEYDYNESYYEQETMSFEAQGIIRTADNKKIMISLSLAMNREFMTEQNISLRLGDAKKIDPLVINFNGTAAQLTDTKFSFDLNEDGKKERISFAGTGSGFLTLDINYDGVVNDGSELFGPKSGNGFADLAGYDSDGNMWIDENDYVFDRLKIWTKDASGRDLFYTLRDKGIGALYLGNISGRFGIKNSSNISLGEVMNTGIYLRETGSAGTLQQIDLMI